MDNESTSPWNHRISVSCFSRHDQGQTLLKFCKANYRRKKCPAGSFTHSAANFLGGSVARNESFCRLEHLHVCGRGSLINPCLNATIERTAAARCAGPFHSSHLLLGSSTVEDRQERFQVCDTSE